MSEQKEKKAGQVRNLAQERAAFAYDEVKKYLEEWKKDKKYEKAPKEFKSHIKDVPMMIKTNGLSAAFAFVFSKKDKSDYAAIQDITHSWLKNQAFVAGQSNQLYESLLKLDSWKHRMVTKEILALFTWLKRMADGMIKDTDLQKTESDGQIQG